jgi:hypothetical protein
MLDGVRAEAGTRAVLGIFAAEEVLDLAVADTSVVVHSDSEE